MKLYHTCLLVTLVTIIVGNVQVSEEEKQATVSQVLKLAETAHSVVKLLKVKRQVYPNSLATKFAKEAGYILENLTRTKRQVYGNQKAINLARKAYAFERQSWMRRQVNGSQAATKLSGTAYQLERQTRKKSEKLKRLSRGKRKVDSNLETEKLARETKRWEKEAFR